MTNDIIADLITRLRNGQKAYLASIRVPYSKFSKNFLDLLYKEGYINSYFIDDKDLSIKKPTLIINLKYINGFPCIKKIEKISKNSSRVYCKVSNIWALKNGSCSYIVSTSKGLMIDEEARRLRLGGELIASIE